MGDLRRSRIATAVLVLGLLLTIIGASGLALLSLPKSGTAVLTDQTYVRLDGRLIGQISGTLSCNYGDYGDVEFVVFDQHAWDLRGGGGPIPDIIVRGQPSHEIETHFSATLPASEAYYLYVSVLLTESPPGYGPLYVEVHWSIWGLSFSYSPALFVLFWLGVAFVLYGEYYAGLRLTVKRKGS